MEVVLEWGAQALAPVHERLAHRLPEMTAQEREALVSQCRMVTERAYDYAGKIKAGLMNNAIDALREEWPMLSQENAGHAFTQAMYYHWKDTGE
ncbi:hypothetical protein ABT09_03755 [bacterium SCN 57-13]|nr:hypothetical protein [Armatimonadota bacterium]ODU51515.1 MAG: hypothetical protein ABT09_03755 [bacterium SCN 57-13]